MNCRKAIGLAFFALACLAIPVKLPAQNAQNEHREAAVHDLSSELRAFYDIADLPSYRKGTLEAQVSSYDTTGGNDDGFSGKYSFLRKNPDGSLVLLDLAGPGVINRIWTPTPTTDTLDFFIDDDSHPALSIRFNDLFSGDVYPFVAPLCGNQLGGYYCYFPILFQKSCRIVDRGKKIQFHQVQYRLFPAGSLVRKFNPVLDADEKASMKKIADLWTKSGWQLSDFPATSPSALLTKVTEINMRPGATGTIGQWDQGGRILGIAFSWNGPSPWNPFIDLRVYWDDEKLPAIDCPLEDFFGYAFGEPSMQSLLLGSRSQKAYCYFPMPFDRRARMEWVYRRGGPGQAVNVHATVFYTNEKRQPDKEGKFYACWTSTLHPAGDGPHVILSANGRGHYVGTLLQASGARAGMTYFFEGDDSTSIDGHPRLHGTGSEDYFNGGWYALLDRWDTRMSLPLHGALDYSLPFCRTGGYRLYLNDKLSFEKSIFQSIEHGPVNNSIPAAYRSLALYYSSLPPGRVQVPSNENAAIRVPDTLMIYPQLMHCTPEGEIQFKTAYAYNTGGAGFAITISGEAALSISLDEIPEGNYQVLLDYGQQPRGCAFSLWKRQTRLTEWLDTKDPGRERVPARYLGTIALGSLAKSLTLRFRASENQNAFYLNRIILVRVQ